jgi:hypothetical protein
MHIEIVCKTNSSCSLVISMVFKDLCVTRPHINIVKFTIVILNGNWGLMFSSLNGPLCHWPKNIKSFISSPMYNDY